MHGNAHPRISGGGAWGARRYTYRCKLAVDILDEVGAELREDLESCWLEFTSSVAHSTVLRAAAAAGSLGGLLPESRAGSTLR